MNIDWSKAPEGADRYYPEDLERGWSESWGKGNKIWVTLCWFDPIHFGGLHKKRLNSCIMRPINSDQQWSGEGLPPVGTICEVYHCDEWLQGEVIAHFQQRAGLVAAYTVEVGSVGSGIKHLDSAIGECFRPLRTPEQIAAEERLHKIRNACTDISRTLDYLKGDIPGAAVARTVIEAMIDAGYRKQEQK